MFTLIPRIKLIRLVSKINFSSLPQIKPIISDTRRIAPNLTIDCVLNSSNNFDDREKQTTFKSRPLVVLMSWLRAKDKYLDVYNDFYQRKGFDVLTAKLGAYDMLYPDYTGKLCLKALETDLSHYEDVIFHSFSFGTYIYGTILLELIKRKTKGDSFQFNQVQSLESRIKGVIVDSVVTVDLILESLNERKDTTNSFKFFMISHQMFLKSYRKTTNYLFKANEVIFNNPLPAPALVMVSESDPFDNVALSEKMVNHWRRGGIDVEYQRWKDGPHVQLMKYNRQEYEKLVDQFVNQINHEYNYSQFL